MSNVTFRQYIEHQLKHIHKDQRRSFANDHHQYHPYVVVHDIALVDSEITVALTKYGVPNCPYNINTNNYIKQVYRSGNYDLQSCHHMFELDDPLSGLTASFGFVKNAEQILKEVLFMTNSRIHKNALIVDDTQLFVYNMASQEKTLVGDFNTKQLPDYLKLIYNDLPSKLDPKLITRYRRWCEQ